MNDEAKTKEQLIKELAEVRRRNAELEAFKAEGVDGWLKILTDNSNIGIYILQNGKFRLANSTFQKLVGYKEDELMGLDSLSLVYPEDRDRVKEDAVRMLKGDSTSPYEFRYVNKSGEVLWVVETVISVLYQGKRATLGNFMDITEQKLLEESLRDSEHKYRTILEIAIDGFWVNNEEGKLLEVNDSYCRMSGYTREELMTMSISDLEVAESPEETHQHIKRVVEKGSDRFETRQRCKDGRIIDVEVSANYIDFGGKLFFITVRDITERKQAETALRESEERFFTAFHNNPSAMAISTLSEGRIIDANESFLQMTEYSREELIGSTTDEINFFGEPKGRTQVLQKLLNGESDHIDTEKEVVIYMKTGKHHKIMGSTKVVTINGQYYLISMARDITELEATKENYRRLVEGINDGYAMYMDGRVVFANNRYGEIFGYEPEQMVGMRIYDFALPENRQSAKERHEKVSRGEEIMPDWRETVAVKRDGTKINLEISRKVIEFEDKSAAYMIVRDITERKKAEAILRESEEKLRLIFESVPEGLIICDMDGKIIDINDGAVRMHGYDTKEEIIGHDGFDLVADRDRARGREAMRMRVETGSTDVVQRVFIRKDGSEFPGAMSAAVMKDPEGKPTGLVVITTDVTEQRKIQEQLMFADRLASIGQLAAGVAHELNNPLSGVVGVSKLLLERDVPDNIKADLEIIDKEATRAANVVRGLLTFTRGKGTEKAPMDINDIIREILQLRSYEQRVSNIEVETDFATNLPHINVNKAQMQQVFMNLIVNTEQAMTEAHDRGNLSINTEKVGDTIRIAITDDGPGITPENMKNIFSPFFTTKEPGKGTGLGLSICHGIITEHGGRIHAESELGKGTCFTLELPIQADVTESEEKV